MALQKIINIVLCCGLLFFTACGAKKKVLEARPQKKNTHTIGQAKSKGNLTAYYADLLGVKEKQLNIALISFIDQWMGTPHRLGGMTSEGIDCSGFVHIAFAQVYHKSLPRTSREMADGIKRKYDHQLKEGDLVFFSFGGKQIDHVGIYLHNDKFVHVSTKQGVVVSNLKDAWYYKYLSRCGTPQF